MKMTTYKYDAVIYNIIIIIIFIYKIYTYIILYYIVNIHCSKDNIPTVNTRAQQSRAVLGT